MSKEATIENNSNTYMTVGCIIAAFISIKVYGLTWWVFPHVLLGWLYVIYALIQGVTI